MTASLQDVVAWLKRELNFFRVHLLFFLIVPLISAVIFWAANGRFHIPFIDALFLCYSALTVTGLSTINLSTCTAFQQAILFFLMCIGNVTIVAWVMVLIRKRYFRQHLQDRHDKERFRTRVTKKLLRFAHFNGSQGPQILVNGNDTQDPTSPGAIRINPADGIGAALVAGGGTEIGLGLALAKIPSPIDTSGHLSPMRNSQQSDRANLANGRSILSDDEVQSPTSLRESMEIPEAGIVANAHSFTSSPRSAAMPLQYPISPTSHSVRFVALPQLRQRPGVPTPRRQRTMIMPPTKSDTLDANELGMRGKDQGLGGFPGPIQVSAKLAHRFCPELYARLEKLLRSDGDKGMKWLQKEFENLIVGRNSNFNTDELDDEDLEKLGGLEALRLLSYLVFFYFVGTQLIAFTLIAPWLATTHQYDDIFDAQPRLVNKPWFVAFQVVGAYTGGGMSLVDSGMVPFQQAYLMLFSMIFAILAGNHGLPIFLRLSIWILTKFVQDGSTADQTLHFLLDHPRRCFLYLFPSHVTWFLTATLVFFTAIEWASFIVLDIGLAVTQSLPVGARVVAGLFQSFAVRASGFAIVSLSSLAPSFQFLCIIMMYIAVYPVALSIRSTNVYEEQSLGVFELPPEDEDEEPELGEGQGSRRERIGKYFGWHLRRQVAYDIWWLVCGIFLICVIERTKIMDDNNAPWFNLFRIVFELVSAFGGIGLTLGIPTENFAFSGAFGPLSKLVVIVIMVRGRHRGLPVAIDRAILLPSDLVPAKQEGDTSNANAESGGVDKAADSAEKGQAQLQDNDLSAGTTLENA
ncbi:unnamed protein product [Somion occarium]|uniref:Potassium transport protein n=1 Tax=Somion occarium TaxID=3059160 RepID=A0ABP1CPY8_9APHY